MQSTISYACIFLSTAVACCISASGAAEKTTAVVVNIPVTNEARNTLYPGNRPPLLASPLIKLPAGLIKPRGWLRKQLELEADGFIGYLTEISSFCNTNGNAWLSSKGEGHSTWEEVPYWFRGYCVLGIALDNPRILDVSRRFVEAMIASQREDGYFGPRKNLGDRGAPDFMPNMSMLFALRSWYEYTGDKRIIELMRKYFKWQLTIPDNKFFSGGWQVPRNGDNLDSVYWLYNITGDDFLLELGEKLMRTGVSWMSGRVTGGHNVDYSQGFRKPGQFYVQSKDPKHLQATIGNYESMHAVYGQVPGGAFGGDEFARPGYTGPRQAIETCGAVELMLSDEILLRVTGDPVWADRCENIAYNTLPATMTADQKALRYLTSPNQVNSDKRSKQPGLANGGPMQEMNPHSHRCCQHNSGMGWPYFAENQWMATRGNGLAAIFYADCVLTARVGRGVSTAIDVASQYPFDDKVLITVSPGQPVQFPLYLRVPGWCDNPVVGVNRRKLKADARPGSYIKIDRVWRKGDKISLILPREIALTVWTNNKDSVSVNYGPLTFSVKIGEEYRRSGGNDTWPAWEILPTTAWNYGLLFDPNRIARSFKVVERKWPEDDMVFTRDGSPLEIRARAKKIPAWTEDYFGLVDSLQPSPAKSVEPVETINLVPMGACRLRISAFPVIGRGTNAHEWKPAGLPLVSYSRGEHTDPYKAIFDGKVPESSYDRKVSRFTTYCFGGAEHGKLHWVRREFDEPKTVSRCSVYWYDETPAKGSVRLPVSWQVLYKDGEQWKPVEDPSGYGIEKDMFNTVTFKPVRTKHLKLEFQCRKEGGRFAAGIYEWRIE